LVDLDFPMTFSDHLNAILDPFICIKLKNLEMDVSHTKIFVMTLKLDYKLYS